MRYTLMHKTVPVAELTMENNLGVIFSVDKLYSPIRLPIGVPVIDGAPDYNKLTKWWASRSIPTSRSGLRELLEKLNMPVIQALVKECYGLSLSEQYWICPKNSDLKWESINFFNNTFSRDIGNFLFDNEMKNTNLDLFSPDITTDGCLKKRWEIFNGKRCLIKRGEPLYHQEPLNEVLTSALLRRMGVPHTDYTLIWENNLPYSVCEDFITPDTELVIAFQICETMPFTEGGDLFEHYLRCCDNLGIPGIQDSLDKMIVLDYIIANTDRHYGNFGVIRNADTLEWIGAAPIFDSGTSLWRYDFIKMIVT